MKKKKKIMPGEWFRYYDSSKQRITITLSWRLESVIILLFLIFCGHFSFFCIIAKCI
ncbi:hypothetical protein KSS87_022552 [Heliosperma pusillum]|nr:hypothetical protein KSS87_022552 [Heliosperma pusillum]